jgi:hypothetical protein
MASKLWTNDSGTWRESKKVWVNDSGTWRESSKIWINDSGTWRQVFSKSTDDFTTYQNSPLSTGTSTFDVTGPFPNNTISVRGTGSGGEGSHYRYSGDAGGGSSAYAGTSGGTFATITGISESVASVKFIVPTSTGSQETDACGNGRDGGDLEIRFYDGSGGTGTEVGNAIISGGNGGVCTGSAGGTGGTGGVTSTSSCTLSGTYGNGNNGSAGNSSVGGAGGSCPNWGTGGAGGAYDSAGSAGNNFGGAGGGPGNNRSITGSGAEGTCYFYWED